MTRYQVPIADPDLEDPAVWDAAEGLTLISVDGPWVPPGTDPARSVTKLVTVEDAGAPPGLAGKIVDLVLARDISQAAPRVLVDSRTVIS